MSRNARNSNTKISPHATKPPNPYLIGLFTAILAGSFSVIGGYYATEFQAKKSIAQKQLEYRILAYSGALEKIDHKKAPVISEILSIGSIADHLASDGEIQEFENRIAELLKKQNTQDLYWQLNSDQNILRLHGSRRVIEICDDILMSLLLRDYEINWNNYSPEVVVNHNIWKANQDQGIAYGWEERVSSDERLMIVTISMLTQALIEQLRREIHGSQNENK